MRIAKIPLLACMFLALGQRSDAQTDIDAIMMEKNAFCAGPMYMHNSWKNYWEGTLKRNNENLGTITTQTIGLMGNYGLSRKLNALFSLPYIRTRASAGVLHPMDGVQDLSFFLKYKPIDYRMGDGRLSVFAIGGLSFPLTDYTADFLPLSIGMRSRTASARLMVDYIQSGFFITGSATYVFRDNIEIDRTSYYTTEMHYTNEVEMPNQNNVNLRLGFRNQNIIAEAVANKMTTLGGFDITRNNMPFPSNRMNATTVGVNVKYVIPPVPQLSVVAGGNRVVDGRNVGQSTTIYGSLFYVLDLSKKQRSTTAQTTNVN